MQLRRRLASLVVVGGVLAAPAVAHAQIAITPMVGGYVPAGTINQVTSGAQTVATTRQGTLSLGGNLDLGFLRGTLDYVSGTTIQDANRQDLGKGNILAAAGDVVIRPLPRILVQPYLIAGAGEKFYRYDQNTSFINSGTQRAFAWHGGVGADLMLGSVGAVAELTDFVSKGGDAKWDAHDAFMMVGMKVKLP